MNTEFISTSRTNQSYDTKNNLIIPNLETALIDFFSITFSEYDKAALRNICVRVCKSTVVVVEGLINY